MNLPSVILGDHGFMRRYGSTLPDAEVLRLMTYALGKGLPMLSGGDFRLPPLIVEAFLGHGSKPRWMMHMDAEIVLRGANGFARAIATLDQALLAQIGERARADRIMGPFLKSFSAQRPLAAGDRRRVVLDMGVVEEQCRTIIDRRPEVVTIGGDATDFLFACGRMDLLDCLIARATIAAEQAGTKVFLCSYIGFCWPEDFRALAKRHRVAGLMVPVNTAGHGMLPSAAAVRANLGALALPVVAMHALAIGVLPLENALRSVLDWPEITAVVVGASTEGHIRDLAGFARSVDADEGVTAHAAT
jgi:hypothetical protein